MHPTPEQLAAFRAGRLTGPEAQAVAAHLDRCPACSAAVASLSAGRSGPLVRQGTRPAVPVAAPAGPPVLPELADHPRYRILRVLGRGAMGIVYEAEHKVMGRHVALKVINKTLLDHPEAVQRFQAEVRSAARLLHPNIVTAYDADQAGDLHFLAMEYVEGLTLDKVLDGRGRLAVPDACRCVGQAALGLQHAYEQGMVHRDIKPANLILTVKGQVKVLDFGLARMITERPTQPGLTKADAFMGTAQYVAPEQAMDARRADIRADIYSLGCTLYCLLAGRPPFVEDTEVKTVLAQIEKEAVPLHQVRPDVPPALSAVVAKMLAKDPAQRYQTPAEVARALAPFRSATAQVESDNRAATAPMAQQAATMMAGPAEVERAFDEMTPSKWLERGRPWGNQWYALAGVVGAVLLVLLGIIVIVKYRGPAGKTSELSVEERTKTSGEKGPKPVVSLPAQYTNSLGMKFAWIPPGSFLMGSPPGEEGHNDYEVQHRVRLTSGFWLGIYPVTQKEWQTVMESNPSHFKGNDRPVEQVSWQDCQEFCRKLSAREGKTYRLPSEAEWEYACRAGTTTAYYFGDDPAMLDDYAWYSENSGSQTRPVGQKKANAWGLYDMHGNVWEWCQDWYGKYPRSEQSDPQGPSGGSSRVFRGGCWHLVPQLCRSAGRSGVEPEYRRYSLGCRLALVPAGVSESSAKVGQRLTQVPPAGEK